MKLLSNIILTIILLTAFTVNASTVSGYITDSNGVPLDGVEVRYGGDYARTQLNGYYELELDDGDYELSVVMANVYFEDSIEYNTVYPMPDYAYQEYGLSTVSGNTTNDLSVDMVVVNISTPYKGAILHSWLKTDDLTLQNLGSKINTTDLNDGSLSVGLFTNQEIDLYLVPQSSDDTTIITYKTITGNNMTIENENGYTLHGKVTDSDGTPIDLAKVSISDQESTNPNPFFVETDINGDFSVKVNGGNYKLGASTVHYIIKDNEFIKTNYHAPYTATVNYLQEDFNVTGDTQVMLMMPLVTYEATLLSDGVPVKDTYFLAQERTGSNPYLKSFKYIYSSYVDDRFSNAKTDENGKIKVAVFKDMDTNFEITVDGQTYNLKRNFTQSTNELIDVKSTPKFDDTPTYTATDNTIDVEWSSSSMVKAFVKVSQGGTEVSSMSLDYSMGSTINLTGLNADTEYTIELTIENEFGNSDTVTETVKTQSAPVVTPTPTPTPEEPKSGGGSFKWIALGLLLLFGVIRYFSN